MKPGLPRQETGDQDDPRIVPGEGHVAGMRRAAQVVLVLAFLVVDLIGLTLVFLPNAGASAQRSLNDLASTSTSPKMPSALATPPSPGTVARGSPTSIGATLTVSVERAPLLGATPPPTSRGMPTATQPPPGIFITGLRFDPPKPLRNQDIHFVVTFLNTTGQPQQVRWDVFVYRANDLQKRFGQSLPIGRGDEIPPGTHELRSFGSYKLFGGGGCEQVVFAVARMEEGQAEANINQPDGTPFLESTTLCP